MQLFNIFSMECMQPLTSIRSYLTVVFGAPRRSCVPRLEVLGVQIKSWFIGLVIIAAQLLSFKAALTQPSRVIGFFN